MTYSTFPDLSPGDQFTATHTDLIRSNFTDHETRIALVDYAPTYPLIANDNRRVVGIDLAALANGYSDAKVVIDVVAPGAFTSLDWDNTAFYPYLTMTSGTAGGARWAQWTSRVSPTTKQFPKFVFNVANVDTTQVDLRIGFGDTTFGNAEPTNGLFFRMLNGNWFAVARAAGSEAGTAFDTGIAASTTLKEFIIDVVSTSSVNFYIAGSLVKNHTSNIPASSVKMFARGMFATHDTTTRTCRFADYASVSFKVKSS